MSLINKRKDIAGANFGLLLISYDYDSKKIFCFVDVFFIYRKYCSFRRRFVAKNFAFQMQIWLMS